MRFKNASEAIERLLDGYDIRLRPDFAGKAVVDECGVLGSCKIYYDNTVNLYNICNEVIGKPLRKKNIVWGFFFTYIKLCTHSLCYQLYVQNKLLFTLLNDAWRNRLGLTRLDVVLLVSLKHFNYSNQ